MKFPTVAPAARRMPKGGALLAPLALACMLAGCASTHSPIAALKIDRSVQATSQNSRVSTVVIHYTATDTPQALEILSKRNVSSHYLITDDEPPAVYQLVDENRRAWHAGESEWYGKRDLNTSSIGIEIVNPGPVAGGWQPYTESQILTLMILLQDIMQRHQIDPRNVVGHSDIAPQRKQDPGPAFPWKRLADAGLARWYDTRTVARLQSEYAHKGLPTVIEIQRALQRAGYPITLSGQLDKATKQVIRAVQMRYRPSRVNGAPDAETVAIIHALR